MSAASIHCSSLLRASLAMILHTRCQDRKISICPLQQKCCMRSKTSWNPEENWAIPQYIEWRCAMQEFKLPDLGEGMQEAEIRRWLIQPGDTVRLDQPMLEVETDKAVVEIPAPVAGRVAAIRVAQGTVPKLGELLLTFDTPTSSPPT